MGFDFRNDNREYLGLTGNAWGQIYGRAVANGWMPQGTLPNRAMIRVQLRGAELPDTEVETEVEHIAAEWAGSYFYNEYQIVEADDAAALADALERSLARATPVAAPPQPAGTHYRADGGPPAAEQDSPLDANLHDLLRKCIGFFRRGRFRVG